MVALAIGNSIFANPTPLDQKASDGLDEDTVGAIKMVYCANYNKCLTLAFKENWCNFSCSECKSYAPPDHEQLQSDVLALLIAHKAAEYVEKSETYVLKDGKPVLKPGNANRIVGVKPGAARKNSARLPVIAERLETPSNTVLVIG